MSKLVWRGEAHIGNLMGNCRECDMERDLRKASLMEKSSSAWERLRASRNCNETVDGYVLITFIDANQDASLGSCEESQNFACVTGPGHVMMDRRIVWPKNANVNRHRHPAGFIN